LGCWTSAFEIVHGTSQHLTFWEARACSEQCQMLGCPMYDVPSTCQTTQRPTDTMTRPGELNQTVTAPDTRTRVHIRLLKVLQIFVAYWRVAIADLRSSVRSPYLPSTEKARSTLPGIAVPEYPEVIKSIPPATVGAMLLIEPPRAFTPFTAWKS